MAENKERKPIHEGYQSYSKRGYQPTQGNLDPSNPPTGGSGVPPVAHGSSGKQDNADKND